MNKHIYDFFCNKNYIQRLCILTNNYYIYDEKYIKNIFNIDSYDKYRKYFKKNHLQRLIFNCKKAEDLFIQLMNIDPMFMKLNYEDNQLLILLNIFVQKIFCPLNNCQKNNPNSYVHDSYCKCRIKVKSVANLSISVLESILEIDDNVFSVEADKSCFIINNTYNRKLSQCFNILDKANLIMGSPVLKPCYNFIDNYETNDDQKKQDVDSISELSYSFTNDEHEHK